MDPITLMLISSAASTAAGAIGAASSARASVRNANAASKAEADAIVQERINAKLRNAYSTSLAQMQLALNKRKLAEQDTGIRAASLAASGDATMAAAATGSVGASTEAVASDIQQRTDQALEASAAQYQQMLTNYNNDLQMMVLNTDESAPTVRPVQYSGPSTGEILGSALLSGATSFASSYAMRAMSLGLGPKVPEQRSYSFSPTRLGAW